MTICKAPGCDKPSKGHSTYCGSCGKRNARHGHPRQRTVTKGALAPYRRDVRRFLDSRSDPLTWEKATARWAALVTQATDTVATFDSGTTMNRWEVGAARLILMVANDAAPKAVVETVAAMALMRERDPRAFQDENAFLVQICRRFAGLTERMAGRYYNAATGKTHCCYRDTPPRTAAILGRILMETVGVIGLVQHRQEQERHRAERAASQALFAALADGGEHVGR